MFLQHTNTYWMISRLCARYNGSISLWTRVTEWKTLKASLLWLLDRPTLLHTEFCWREHHCKTIWLNCGVYSISCCQKSSTRARNSKSGLISRWAECTLWHPKHLKKKTHRFLNYQRKSNYSSSTDYIKFLDPFCWEESRARWRKNCHLSPRWLSKFNCPLGKRWFTTVSLNTADLLLTHRRAR